MTNGLTNLGLGFFAENTLTLNEFAPGSAFSAVYNPLTRQFLALPSGESRLLSGAEPQNLVARRGGHGEVNKQFSRMTGTEPTSNMGFTIFLEADVTMTIEWRSASVNSVNPSFTGDLTPEALRPMIIEDIGNATGRIVRSR